METQTRRRSPPSQEGKDRCWGGTEVRMRVRGGGLWFRNEMGISWNDRRLRLCFAPCCEWTADNWTRKRTNKCGFASDHMVGFYISSFLPVISPCLDLPREPVKPIKASRVISDLPAHEEAIQERDFFRLSQRKCVRRLVLLCWTSTSPTPRHRCQNKIRLMFISELLRLIKQMSNRYF